MLGPRFDEEPFDDPARLARVFGHAPGVGAVAAALGRQVLHGLQEGGQIGLGDAVFDLHHHRAPVVRHRLGQQRLGPVVRGLQVGLTGGQLHAVKDERRRHQTDRAHQQRNRQAGLPGDEAPAQAAGGHRAVEDHEVDGQAPAAHPVGQHGLGHAVEGGQRDDPSQAQHQHQRHGGPLGRGHGQHAHDGGGEQRGQQHQAVGVEPFAQAGQQHGAQDGARAHGAQHHAVKACRAAQHAARHQRQQRPDGAGEQEEHGCAQQHHMQLAAGAGVAHAGAEGAEELLVQA
ncbi:hypothetical protein D3C71_1386470 [compost metagenome]